MPSKAFPGTVIFDLDGTLVDSAPDLTRTLNYILKREGRRPVGVSQVRDMVGRGARALIEAGLAHTGAPAEGPGHIDRLLPQFLEFYAANIALESRPFPGVIEVLNVLRQAETRMAICTNKVEALSVKLLAELGLDHYFSANVGGDSLPMRKPDPGHLLGAIEAAGGDPADAVMIGDSTSDAEAAKAAGVPVVLVGFGYSHVPVESLGGDIIIRHFAELPRALSEIRSKAA